VKERELQALKVELARVSCKAYGRRLVFGTGGNISVRVPGIGFALITPTGVSLGDTTVDNIAVIDIETGETTADSPTRASKERYFHAVVYGLRQDINALVHVHPPYATAWSVRGEDLPLVTVSGQGNFGRVPCAACAPSGSTDLRDHVARVVAENPGLKAMLMCRHGILTLGTDLVNAYNLADLVEDCAKVAWLAQRLPD
jgi:L-ribulose-5-phosphate 4-epimerase